jgi:two-component system chemotaxis sensor kinase CheA
MAGITEDTLISEFVAESRDHLDSLEPDLLLMEQEGENVSSEVVNRAFRAIHSIKGSSSVLGFDSLMKLSHIMENVLMQIRNKKMIPDAHNIDALLQSGDKLSFMIDDVHASNQVDCTEEIKRLNEILEEQSQTGATSSSQTGATSSTSLTSSTSPQKQNAEIKKISPSPSENNLQQADTDTTRQESSVSNNARSEEETSVGATEELSEKMSDDVSQQKDQSQSLEPEVLSDISQPEDDVQEEQKEEIISVSVDSQPDDGSIVLTESANIHIDIHGPDHMECHIASEKFFSSYHEEKKLYAIWIYGATDLLDKNRSPEEFLNDMISFGTYLYSDFVDKNKNTSAIFHMVIFTILEKKLLLNAIDIPDEQIYMFPPQTIHDLIQQIEKVQPDISSQSPETKKAPPDKKQKEEKPQDEKPRTEPAKDSSQHIDVPDGAIISETSTQESDSDYMRVSSLNTETGLKLEASGPDIVIFEIDNSKVESIIEKKKNLFVVWVNPQKDLTDKSADVNELVNDIKSLGECITHDFDRTIVDSKTQYHHMLVSSIMEKDLLCNGLDFPKNQISQFLSKDLLGAINQNDMKHRQKKPQPAATQNTKKSVDIEPHPKQAPKKQPVPARQQKRARQAHITENLRVPVDLIDRLMNLAGELVLGRNQLRQEIEEKVVDNPRLINVMQNVNLVTSEIQENIMRMRMQPLSSIFNKFPRVVRDIARQLYKKAEIIIDGGEVELDKSILENLSDPLTHIIRNSLDHGIEPPEVRVKNNKQETGLIHLTATHEGSQVIIKVSDNGRGIDADVLAEKVISSNLVTQENVARMSTKQKTNLIFLPGFSTAKTVSDISGRGVGMDVVKTNIEKLGGHVDLDTTVGKGTVVIIRLPLTLSIIPSLIVGACGYIFAIPQINVQELVTIKESEIARRMEKVGDATVLRLRERLLPMVWLHEVLGLKSDKKSKKKHKQIVKTIDSPTATDNGKRFLEVCQLNTLEKNINIVVLRVGSNSFGLAVNQLFDNEEIVVKPLSRHIKDCKCFSGSTIMGDGRVAMILDTAGIADFAFLRFAEISAEERRRREQEERDKKEASRRKPVLLFNNALDEYFGLPLSNISRLELISKENIHLVGQREYINYNGKGLPLIRLENFLAVNPLPELDELYLIIPKTNGPVAGIMVSRIINILDIQEDIARDAYTPKGFLGSGFIEGYLTFFLDPNAILQFLEEEGV